MGRTRTPGITIHLDGNPVINKKHLGVRLFLRVGKISQDERAENNVEASHAQGMVALRLLAAEPF